jgi:type I restriction enzyme S subunit
MKKGWKYKKLGEVANVNHGKNQKAVEDVHGKYPIYGSGGNIMGFANSYLCDAGTTILGRKGTINNPIYIETKFWNVDTAFGISAKEGTDKKYIYYFVKSQDWSKKDTGTTLPSLTQKVVKDTTVPVPPLSEQQRIVSYLDATFAKIDAVAKNAEKSLNDAKSLFQSALTKMMEPKEGWEEKALKMCSTKIGDGLHGTPKYDENGEYYFINGNNLDDGKIEISNTTKRVNIIEYNKNKVDLNENSVLLSINGTIGKTAFYNDEKIILGKSACYINVIPILKKEYLRYFFLSKRFLDYAKHNVRQATIMNLGLREIREMKLFIPPISTQQTIVVTLDSLKSKVDQLQSNFFRTLAECAALKQSILRQTFE